MLNRISKSLSLSLAEKCNKPDYQDIYQYALEMVISTAFTSLMIFCLACMITGWKAGVIFMLFFSPLRTVVGGFHAKTYGKCFLISGISFGCVALVYRFICLLDIRYLFFYVLFVVAAIYIVWKAPMIHPNQPLSEERIRKNMYAARVMIVVYSIIVSNMMYLKTEIYYMEVLAILLVALFMLVPEILKIIKVGVY